MYHVRGPRGSFVDSEGSGRFQRGIEGVPEMSLMDAGGPLEKGHFVFFGGENFDGLIEYRFFQFCVVL